MYTYTYVCIYIYIYVHIVYVLVSIWIGDPQFFCSNTHHPFNQFNPLGSPGHSPADTPRRPELFSNGFKDVLLN